ncbi:MAG: hypothetical protein R3A11_07095 [Bdellovibrionota bacterium]
MKPFFQTLWTLLRLELMLDGRKRFLLYSNVLFCALCMFLFKVVLREPEYDHLAGMFWLVSLFSCHGIFLLRNSHAHADMDHHLLHTGIDAYQLFVGKSLGSMVQLLGIQIACGFLMALFFGFDVLVLWNHTGAIVAVDASIAWIGTLMMGSLRNSSVGKMMFSLFFYPLLTPVFLLGYLTLSALSPDNPLGQSSSLLWGIFCIFLAISLMVSSYIWEE